MEMLPPLRHDIEILPYRHGGEEILVVRDSLGIARAGLALSTGAVRFFPFFDGTRSLEELQIALARDQGGVLVPQDELRALVEEFDRLGLLQTESYRRARDRIVADFYRETERSPALAGDAYPAEPGALAEEIDRILEAGGGDTPSAGAPPRAVVAPHIDLKVSGPSYGLAYGALRCPAPSAVAILGTGHSLEDAFCLTEKTFLTPLGRIPAARETVRRLREAGGSAVAPDDFAHRGEHSIEFQLLFLQRLFAMEQVPIIPILCGPLDHFMNTPRELPAIARFVDELGAWLDEPPGGKLVVAGVDLSHVGPKFGDPVPASSLESHFRAADEALLATLEQGDADLFYKTVAGNSNRYKVCGFSALWTLLAVLPGLRGRLFDYRVWHEEATHSAVSFAALAFGE
jgi:AmmeMemoRadiSam system protein B